MKKSILSVLVLLIIAAVIIITTPKNKSTEPIINPPITDNDTIPNGDNTGLGLNLPPEFGIAVFADEIEGARAFAFDLSGNLWVSQISEDKISKVTVTNNVATRTDEVLTNLKSPHGLAFDPINSNILYFAEEDKISRVDISSQPLKPEVIKDGFPTGGRHVSRTIKFGPDDRLYLSIGSSCNVCIEENEFWAKIFSMRKDGTDFREEARGLRNTVFFTWSYVDGKMWGTDMGSDHLGEDLPPDEINIIERGKNYGWPNCYGKNNHDDEFDKKTYIRNPCMEPFETGSHVDLQAHSAPLGLGFISEEGWPEEYWHNLIVAYHGSSFRDEETGYKLVRIVLDDKGNYIRTEDFITGWLQGKEVSGRPVDVMIQPGGVMYISDDKAGVIYKVTYNGNE